MQVTCPQCRAVYGYDEARFGGADRKRLKCPRCGDIFVVRNPLADVMDSTGAGKDAGVAKTPLVNRVGRPEAPELPALPELSRNIRYSLAALVGAGAGSVYTLTKPRIYLGRGAGSDVQVRDAEVSRRHAMLEIRGDRATLTDLGSTNGTWVDGERVEHAELQHQSEFTIGATTLMFLVTHLGGPTA
jgi:predicted Zn finger-like uncharacterized protein